MTRLKPHRIAWILVSALAVLAPGLAPRAENLYSDLPSIGDSAGSVISPVEERKLGAMFMRSIRQSGMVLDDLEITSYLRSLGRRLATNSETPAQQFIFFVVNEPSINAFAGPGGYIGVHTGLFLASDQQDAIVFHHLQGCSLAELSDYFGRSQAAVAGLLHRALKRLRAKLNSNESASQ